MTPMFAKLTLIAAALALPALAQAQTYQFRMENVQINPDVDGLTGTVDVILDNPTGADITGYTFEFSTDSDVTFTGATSPFDADFDFGPLSFQPNTQQLTDGSSAPVAIPAGNDQVFATLTFQADPGFDGSTVGLTILTLNGGSFPNLTDLSGDAGAANGAITVVSPGPQVAVPMTTPLGLAALAAALAGFGGLAVLRRRRA